MKFRASIQCTASQKAQMWDQWQQGASLRQIARLFDRCHSSVHRILADSGWMLSLAEREEISRGVVRGQSGALSLLASNRRLAWVPISEEIVPPHECACGLNTYY